MGYWYYKGFSYYSKNVGAIGITKVGCVSVRMLGLVVKQELVLLQLKWWGYWYHRSWLSYSENVLAIGIKMVGRDAVRMLGLSV